MAVNFGVHHITELQLVCEILNEPGRQFPAGADSDVLYCVCVIGRPTMGEALCVTE